MTRIRRTDDPARANRAVEGKAAGGTAADEAGESGFVLLESIVSMALLAIIMAALTTFSVTVTDSTAYQRQRQAAVQLANTEMEQLRGRRAGELYTGRSPAAVQAQFRDAPAAVRPWLATMTPATDTSTPTPAFPLRTSATVNSTQLTAASYLGWCSVPAEATADAACTGSPAGAGTSAAATGTLRAVVAVTWAGSHCPGDTCSYVTATLLSTAADPVFTSDQKPPAAPEVTRPSDQTTVVGVAAGVTLSLRPGAGVGPITWQQAGLPAGLTLDPVTGVISGSPKQTTAKPATVTVTATDAYLRTATATFSWTVVTPVAATAPSTQTSVVRTPVPPLALVASGGSGSYTWTDPGRTLPAGLTLSADGRVTGTPTTVAQYSVRLTVTDPASGSTTTMAFGWTVTYPPLDTRNPDRVATVGGPVGNVVLTASGGSGGPYTWTDTGSSLPSGLTLSSAGVVTGTPRTAGTVAVRLQVSDAASGQTSAVAFTWTVNAAPTVTGLAPTYSVAPGAAFPDVVLPFTCPTGACTIALSGAPAGLALATDGSGAGSASVPVTATSGTVRLRGSVGGSVAAGSYPVAVTPTDTTTGVVGSAATTALTISTGCSAAQQAAYATAIAADSPSLWYRLGERTGTTATDSGSSRANGVYVGNPALGLPGALECDSDTAVGFDGTTNEVTPTAQIAAPRTFSLEAWFSTTTGGGKLMGFGSQATGISGSYDRHVYLTDDGRIAFGDYNGQTHTIITDTRYDDGTYHHVVATLSPTAGMVLYVDGVATKVDPTTTAEDHAGYWRVGNDNLNGWEGQSGRTHYTGTLDEVAFYPAALTAQQVATHYAARFRCSAAQKVAYTNQVTADSPSLYYRLGEASGTVARDRGSARADGTYVGSARLGLPGAIGCDPDTAAGFDGNTTEVTSSADAIAAPATFSLEAWFSTTTGGGKIIGFGNSRDGKSGNYDRHVYLTDVGNVVFGVYNNGFHWITSPGTYEDGRFHHVVATLSPTGGMVLYVDGAQVGTDTNSVGEDHPGYWRVGYDNLDGWPGQPGNSHVTGTLDEVAVYPTALSAERVAAHYAQTPPVPATPPKPSLAGVHHWAFDEGTGTTAGDLVGTAPLSLLGGAAWTAGRSGQALALNGDRQSAEAGKKVLDTEGVSYSVSGWVRFNRIDGGYQTLASQDGDRVSAFYLQYAGADRRLAFSFAGGRALANTVGEPRPGQWYHLVGVRDAAAGQLLVYVDGQLAGSVAAPGADASTGTFAVGRGRWEGNPVDFLDGAADDVRAYDRALTATEIAALHQGGAAATAEPGR